MTYLSRNLRGSGSNHFGCAIYFSTFNRLASVGSS
jgi:hypothetical protein